MRRLGASSPGGQPYTKQAQTLSFSESDVELTTTNTATADGVDHVALWGEGVFENTSRPDDTDEFFGSEFAGMRFEPNVPLYSVRVTRSSLATQTGEWNGVRLRRASDGSTLDTVTSNGISPGDTFTLTAPTLSPLLPGEQYDVFAYGDGGGDPGLNPDPGFPISGPHLDLVDGYPPNDFPGEAVMWSGVSGADVLNDGSAAVELPYPPDVSKWDLATFRAAEDGETVEVYIEESTDGGDSWSRIQGPISRGASVEASSSSRVRFGVDLSRQDGLNNPTFDGAYLRWEV